MFTKQLRGIAKKKEDRVTGMPPGAQELGQDRGLTPIEAVTSGSIGGQATPGAVSAPPETASAVPPPKNGEGTSQAVADLLAGKNEPAGAKTSQAGSLMDLFEEKAGIDPELEALASKVPVVTISELLSEARSLQSALDGR